MVNFETRSAIALVLSLGLTASVVAQEATTTAQPSADTQQAESSATNWDAGNSSFGNGGVFGAASTDNAGISQRSAAAAYQLGGAGVASSGRSVEGNILTSPTRGRPIRFDNGIFVYPSASIGYGRNDNVLGTQTNKVSSSFFVVRPELVGEIKTHGDRYTLSYQGNYGRYQSSSADNFNHHELWLGGDNYFTTRARLGWGVGYLEKSDPRGSTDRASSAEPDRWHAPIARVLGIYGAPGSIGRLELEGSMMQKRYDNNRATTIASDVDLNTVAGRFYYRFMPKTSVLFEVRNTWADYVWANSTQDNTDTRYYAGFVWDATAKTTGTLKLGRAYKRFDDASRQDASVASWEASVRWAPLTYSTVDLVASRAPLDSTGTGNYVLNNATTLTWNHKWASYVSSRVNYGVIKSDYKGSTREDDTKNYGVGFFHELGYRMRAGIDWTRTDRTSNDQLYNFKRDVTMVTLEAVL